MKKLQKKSQKNLEPRNKEELKRRINVVQGVIELAHLDTLRSPPTDEVLYQIAKSWMIHFDRANIPTDAILDLYYEAMASKKETSMFSPTNIIAIWKTRKQELTPVVCGICSGTGKVRVLNISTMEDELNKCICQR